MDEETKREKRRSSILKTKRSSERDLEIVSKRVSFSQRKSIKEFDPSVNTLNNSTYEENTKEWELHNLPPQSVDQENILNYQEAEKHYKSHVTLRKSSPKLCLSNCEVTQVVSPNVISFKDGRSQIVEKNMDFTNVSNENNIIINEQVSNISELSFTAVISTKIIKQDEQNETSALDFTCDSIQNDENFGTENVQTVSKTDGFRPEKSSLKIFQDFKQATTHYTKKELHLYLFEKNKSYQQECSLRTSENVVEQENTNDLKGELDVDLLKQNRSKILDESKEKSHTFNITNQGNFNLETSSDDIRNISNESDLDFHIDSKENIILDFKNESNDKECETVKTEYEIDQEILMKMKRNLESIDKDMKILNGQESLIKKSKNVDAIYLKARNLLSKTFEIELNVDNFKLEFDKEDNEDKNILTEIEKHVKVEMEKVLTVRERVENMEKNFKRSLRLKSSTCDRFSFEIFYYNLIINVDINQINGQVLKFNIIKKIDEKLKPSQIYLQNEFIKRMDVQCVSSAVGDKYDIFTLLDYIQLQTIHVNEIDEYLLYLSKFGCEISDNFWLTIKIPCMILQIIWTFSFDLSNLNVDDNKFFEIKAEVGSVDKEKVRSLLGSCPVGFNFIRHVVSIVLSYLRNLRMRKIN